MSESAELPPQPERRPPKPRKKTFGGAMLAAAMVGLQEALEGPKDEPAIIEVGNSTGDDDEPIAVDLDPEDPSQSIAVIRPWLRK
jgi:hypothetical protein